MLGHFFLLVTLLSIARVRTIIGVGRELIEALHYIPFADFFSSV
jgi:hypothetical protein